MIPILIKLIIKDKNNPRIPEGGLSLKIAFLCVQIVSVINRKKKIKKCSFGCFKFKIFTMGLSAKSRVPNCKKKFSNER